MNYRTVVGFSRLRHNRSRLGTHFLLQLGRQFYDIVFDHMTYSKEGDGWALSMTQL